MPNHLTISAPARVAIDKAGGDGREEMFDCLGYLQAHPEPDGSCIVAISKPPAILYAYHCGIYDVVFSVDWIFPRREARIKVLGIF